MAVQALFEAGMPAALRCWAVLDGLLPGQVWADDPARPSWAVLREALFGTLYLGGQPKPEPLLELLVALCQEVDVLYGYWPETTKDQTLHAGLTAVELSVDYQGHVLEFWDRDPRPQQTLPIGRTLRPLDGELFEHCFERGLLLETYGSKEKALEKSLSLCLVDGDGGILCEAHAGPAVRGWIELGVVTHPQQRGKGYATLTCAALAGQCEAAGFQTYWNCAAQNRASAALARRLGYRREREYALRAWYRLR
jgi:GNAT superfamily N-acetyltransferase